jgi:hypothetical protein
VEFVAAGKRGARFLDGCAAPLEIRVLSTLVVERAPPTFLEELSDPA